MSDLALVWYSPEQITPAHWHHKTICIADTHAFVMRRKCVSVCDGIIFSHKTVETAIIGGKTERVCVGGDKFNGADETEDVRAAWQFMLPEANEIQTRDT